MANFSTGSAISSKNYGENIVEKMFLDEKIGQMLLMHFRGWKQKGNTTPEPFETLNDEIAKIIKDYHIGNIILFGESLVEVPKIVKLTSDLQRTATEAGLVPMLIAADQEGGIVTRIGPGTCMPGNLALGATGNHEHAYKAGRIFGKELLALGINCDLAPVVDIDEKSDNFIVRDRSFGCDKDLVASMAVEIMRGLHEEGVCATGKHFPGKGSVNLDSHFYLPTTNKTMDEMEACEFIPFRELIKNGVDLIMTSHYQAPNVDNTKCISKMDGKEIYTPATLSKTFITDILRDRLRFEGVILTDAMDMKAISDNFGEVDAIVRAIKAGSDMICMPVTLRSKADIHKLDEVYSAVKTCVESGEIAMDQIDASVRRIIKLKKDRGILALVDDTATVEEKTENALKIVGCNEHRELERVISSDAITVLKNENNVLPFKLEKGQKVLIITPYENEIPSSVFSLNRLIKEEKIPEVILDSYCYNKQTELGVDLKEKINSADKIILFTETSAIVGKESSTPNYWGVSAPRSIIDYAKDLGKASNFCVVSLSAPPYDAENYLDVKALLLTYGYLGMVDPTDAKNPQFTKRVGPNIPAAIEVIFGAAIPKGELPVKIEGVN